MCSVIDQSDVVPGLLCLTVNQTQQLVTNPVGSWELLPGIVTHQSSPTYFTTKNMVCVYMVYFYMPRPHEDTSINQDTRLEGLVIVGKSIVHMICSYIT